MVTPKASFTILSPPSFFSTIPLMCLMCQRHPWDRQGEERDDTGARLAS
jgi:hypothetical protein